ncbi:MAG: ABC transporter substrate-binding protein, partial [Geminicoccaceae bacterium]
MTVKTDRRRVLGGMALAGAAGIAAPALLTKTRAYAQERTIKVGHVSPRTGPLAGFAEADEYILEGIRAKFAEGIEGAGGRYAIEIITADSQSNPNRAAEVASDLILGEEVDIITAASTPDTTNPVADQAELNEVPCITTDCPWQPYFFGRSGDPAVGFESTYHFFW